MPSECISCPLESPLTTQRLHSATLPALATCHGWGPNIWKMIKKRKCRKAEKPKPNPLARATEAPSLCCLLPIASCQLPVARCQLRVANHCHFGAQIPSSFVWCPLTVPLLPLHAPSIKSPMRPPLHEAASTCTNVPNCPKCLFKCPGRNFYGQRQSWLHFAKHLRLGDKSCSCRCCSCCCP